MPNWQRRRYPRSDFVQDGLSPRVTQQLQQWWPASDAETASFTARKRAQQHAGYKTQPQDGPVAYAQIGQNTVAPFAADFYTYPPPSHATRTRIQQHTGYKAPFQDGPVAYFQANQTLLTFSGDFYTWAPRTPKRPVLYPHTEQQTGWITNAQLDVSTVAGTGTFATRPPVRSIAQYRQLADQERFSGLAPPPATYDTLSMFPALDTFAQRLTYRTGRKPNALGGGGIPSPPPIDPTLAVAAYGQFFDPPRKRKQVSDLGVSEDFGVPLTPGVVWPVFESFWSTPPRRRRLYPSTEPQLGWLFPDPVAVRQPAQEPLWPQPPRRARLYPHTEPQQGWLFAAVPAAFDPQLWPPADRPFAPPTPKRRQLYPSTEPQQGWLFTTAGVTTDISGTAVFAPRTPARKRLHPSTEPQDGWITLANPVIATFDPQQTPLMYPLAGQTPRRRGLYPSTEPQNWWLSYPDIAGVGTPGGFGQAPSLWQVQYMDIAAPLRPEPTNLDAAAAPTLLTIPGPSVQFQDIVEPPIAPPNPTPTEPAGIAALLVRYPTDPYRRQQLPEMGTVLAFQEPFYPSGSVLSWQPVYEGHAGLPVVLHPFGPATVFSTIVTPSAPPGTAAYAARYPDRVGREPGRGYPNYGPSITWTPIPITPPAPPVQKKKTDLRRREQLGIRRTIY